jgi:hypothetical protein
MRRKISLGACGDGAIEKLNLAVIFCVHIWWVLDLNMGADIGYSDADFSLFSSAPLREYRGIAFFGSRPLPFKVLQPVGTEQSGTVSGTAIVPMNESQIEEVSPN